MRQIAPAILLAALCLGSDFTAHAAGPRPHLDSLAAAALNQNKSSRVIVRYRAGSGGKMQDRLRARRVEIRSTHRRANAITLTAGRKALQDLLNDPDIVGISTDALIHPHGASIDPADWLQELFDAQQLRSTLGLSPIPSGGANIGVAVIDSGIAPVADLASRITAFYDFTAGGIAAAPSDAYGHGTHVAGLIAGSGLSSLGAYPGIAPQARLIGLKVLDANGAGYTSDVIAAIDFAIDQRAALGIDIINLSLGHPILEPAATDPLVQAVERASAAGIIVVASAGNYGRKPGTDQPGFGGIASPGNAPSALTIGALATGHTTERGDDAVPNFSSRGPAWYDGTLKPDVLAPGVGLMAAGDPSSTLGRKKMHWASGPYMALNGTSMASAVATGVVALIIEASREEYPQARLTPNAVKLLLQYSAVPVETSHSAAELIEGAGGINAAGALELARAIDPTAAVGAPWLTHGVTPASSIGGQQQSWARRVTWGDRLVLGEVLTRREHAWAATPWGTNSTWSPDISLTSSTVIDNFAIWSAELATSAPAVMPFDDHIVWGSSDDDHIVWGNSDDDHIVWGNSDDDHIVWGNSTDEADADAAPLSTYQWISRFFSWSRR